MAGIAATASFVVRCFFVAATNYRFKSEVFSSGKWVQFYLLHSYPFEFGVIAATTKERTPAGFTYLSTFLVRFNKCI